MTGAEPPLPPEPPDDGPPPERLPPQDVPAEQSVLGAMLLSRDALIDVAGILQPGDFYRPAHELIYTAALALHERGEPVDAVTVAAELARRGDLVNAGGPLYPHTLISMVPTAANATPSSAPATSSKTPSTPSTPTPHAPPKASPPATTSSTSSSPPSSQAR
jgi:hypothetical protein